jgi:Tfp pilus assembly protein PilF
MGELSGAATRLKESLTLFREIGDETGYATTLNTAGLVALRQRDDAAAEAYFAESLVLQRRMTDLNKPT